MMGNVQFSIFNLQAASCDPKGIVQFVIASAAKQSSRRNKGIASSHEALLAMTLPRYLHPRSATPALRAGASVKNPQSGASLVEILVAVGIIASALVIFIAALSTAAFAVRASNQLTTANNLAASQLESIKAAAYVTGTASYPGIAAPPGYSVSNVVTELGAGLQQVTVTVSYTGGSVAVSNYKVNR
jgi:Tfp pilus assembly protein PilV